MCFSGGCAIIVRLLITAARFGLWERDEMNARRGGYEAALVKMSAIYTRIAGQGARLLAEGSRPAGMIATREGGPAITFRHEVVTSARLSALSAAIAGVVPIMRYPAQNIQTTVNAIVLRRPYDTTEGDRGLMGQAADCVDRALCAYRRGGRHDTFSITLARPIANSDTCLAPGWPNFEVFYLRAEILEACLRRKAPVTAPWGSQVVVGRFLEKAPGDRFAPLLDLFDAEPETIPSRLVAVDVIENIMDETGQFVCQTYASFPI